MGRNVLFVRKETKEKDSNINLMEPKDITYKITKYSNAIKIEYDERSIMILRKSDGGFNLCCKAPNDTEEKPFIYEQKDGMGNLVIGISPEGLEAIGMVLPYWKGLEKTDPNIILIHKILNKHPDKAKEYKEGNTALLGLFMGEVMKESTEEPETIKQLLKSILN